jgi:UDP-N-acetylglucosamine--N-acetylmuramyl-(pentapeptide) pyrophosphoryl-undecaprenol N-acetylglucosamine transferase
VVIGTGGYSSGLPLLAAIHKGIKTVIQEQNSYPGITTRHLAGRVDAICIAYKDAAAHLKKKIQFSPEIPFERIYR